MGDSGEEESRSSSSGSCNSRRVEYTAIRNRKQRRRKVEVYNDVVDRLKQLNVDECRVDGFQDQLWSHFRRLPNRYALDVNVERAQDVLVHKRLLDLALDPATRPAVEVRLVQALENEYVSLLDLKAYSMCDLFRDSDLLDAKRESGARCCDSQRKEIMHLPPAFGFVQDVDCNYGASALSFQHMHEITISTTDKPKLLSQLTSFLSEIGLNIQEAHAFSTTDGYSLDVFVVDGWKHEETEQLKTLLVKEIPKLEKHFWSNSVISSPAKVQIQNKVESVSCHVHMSADGSDPWEIDLNLLKYKNEIATGSFGDLYKGTLVDQDVAIKLLKAEHLTEEIRRDLMQEVYILRKLQHENVVQFIGACTRTPNLCIVTEFMSGGSVYDFLHKRKGAFRLPSLLKVAIDIAKGMEYLHQNNIIHRDLKSANLLINKNGVVKISDFGVARVQDQSGVMTAETGTYRWMAPEVIGHEAYDHKADVFSFGVVLWELLTGKLPYDHLSPLQAAIGVVQKGLRPTIPTHTHPKIVELLERCWEHNPSLRPDFSEIKEVLQHLAKQVAEAEELSEGNGSSSRIVYTSMELPPKVQRVKM